MAKDDIVLKHETRRMIYNHIAAHPGVSFSILKEVFGLADGTLRYHLDYLKRSEKITNGLEGGKRCYYPAGHTAKIANINHNGEPEFVKLNEVQERLVSVIRRYPGINQKELSRKTNLNRFAVRNNIEKLMHYRMIRKVPERNMVCYECVSKGKMEYETIKTLILKLVNGEISDEEFNELRKQMENS